MSGLFFVLDCLYIHTLCMRETKAPKRLCVPLRLCADLVRRCDMNQNLKWGPLVCLLVSFLLFLLLLLLVVVVVVVCFVCIGCIGAII